MIMRIIGPFVGISLAFKKMKNNEQLQESEIEALKNFINEFTTVSTNEMTVGERVSRIVLAVNIHSHTKSCRKYACPCRFFYPRFPCTRTIIAQPIQGVKDEEKKQRLKRYEEVLDKVRDVLNDTDTIEEIIREIGSSEKEPLEEYKVNKVRRIKAILKKANVSLEEYEEALSYTKTGYKVTIERDLTEMYVNSYNVEWIEAWNGNMDMQPCFDYHATITYITDYYGKDDTGLMELINSVVKQDTSENTKKRMKMIANTFMTNRQIGEAEAVYRLIPNMVLKNSNVSCQWLSVGKRSEMSKRWKLASKDEVENREVLVEIKDREGLWYMQQDKHSKFLRRPDNIELICPVQFGKMFTTSGLKQNMKNKIQDLENDEDRPMDEKHLITLDKDTNYDTNKEKFHFLMTDSDMQVPLPKIIEIRDPYPGEPR